MRETCSLVVPFTVVKAGITDYSLLSLDKGISFKKQKKVCIKHLLAYKARFGQIDPCPLGAGILRHEVFGVNSKAVSYFYGPAHPVLGHALWSCLKAATPGGFFGFCSSCPLRI